MNTDTRTTARIQVDPGERPPPGSGTYEDAERLRKWSFRRRSPQQRFEWLMAVLEIAYRRGALKQL
jgi:hypothetical protein